MKNQIKPLLFFTLLLTTQVMTSSLALAVPSLSQLIAHAEEEKLDPLTLRVLIKKIGSQRLSSAQWNKIRKLIYQNQNVGYDILYKWETIDPKPLTTKEIQMAESQKKADALMLSEDFEASFKMFQEIAEKAKVELVKNPSLHYFFYSILHSMGRALYGSSRYSEALQVYDWIPKKYPLYRQVLFEKMWAGFQMGRMDVAYGMIASQQSEYFTKFAEPELYLVESYVLKKLCREKELKRVLNKLKKFKEALTADADNVALEFAKSDVQTFALAELSIFPNSKIIASPYVSAKDRQIEKEKISQYLNRKWQTDRTRLLKEIDQVIGYSLIAGADDNLKLEKFTLPSRDELLSKGMELWRADDGEQWLDEIGDHIFVGESKCQKTN